MSSLPEDGRGTKPELELLSKELEETKQELKVLVCLEKNDLCPMDILYNVCYEVTNMT